MMFFFTKQMLKGNQVQILNRPAAVSPAQKFEDKHFLPLLLQK
jgi:hypothetical protein